MDNRTSNTVYSTEEDVMGETDEVKKPNHYTQGEYEAIDIIEYLISDLTGAQAYSMGNVLKYVIRCNDKSGWKDIRKARQYLSRFVTGEWEV